MITVKVSFYCDSCQEDFDLEAWRDHITDNGKKLSYFRVKCPKCGRKLVRYIEERAFDPYFTRSKKLRIQRKILQKDLLQPGDFGFASTYPEEWKKIEAAREQYEVKKKMEEEKKVAFYNKFKHNSYERSLARKVLEAEEKI